MEASEATAPESTEQAAPDQSGDGDAFTRPEPAPEPETAPTDVGEALQEMRQELAALRQSQQAPPEDAPQSDLMSGLLSEIEEPEPEPDAPEAPEQPQGDDQVWDEVRSMIRQEAEAALTPHLQRQEYDRRVSAIEKLAERYPDLKEETITNAVAESLRPLAAQYGNGVYTDPLLVERAYKAYKADAVAAAEGSPEGETREANLEQGGGPAVPEPEMSPDEQRYAEVFKRPSGVDPMFR